MSWAVPQFIFDLLCASGSTKPLPNRQNTTTEKFKKNLQTGKKQLLNNKKTIAEPAKPNCRNIKKQLPKN